MSLVMYAIPFFILLMGVEYAYGRVRGRNTYRLADTIRPRRFAAVPARGLGAP